MNTYIQAATNNITSHKKQFITGAVIVAVIAGLIALFAYNNPPVVVYQPTDACALFTPAKAQDLLGNKVINVNTNKTTVSGNIAVSKCSYTDSNPDKNMMLVAAIAVRSGVNDKGVQQNKTEFASAKASSTVTAVKNVGDSAFFNPTLGQLNILSGRRWIIISDGVGATPETNSVDQAVTLAKKLL